MQCHCEVHTRSPWRLRKDYLGEKKKCPFRLDRTSDKKYARQWNFRIFCRILLAVPLFVGLPRAFRVGLTWQVLSIAVTTRFDSVEFSM